MKTTVVKVLKQVQQLESLPLSAQRILQELSRREATIRSVSHFLEEDPPLAARVLRVANSGMYAARSKTGTISQAIARLGLRETQQLVAAGSMAQMLPTRAPAAVTAASLYVHALASAASVEIVRRHVGAECRGAIHGAECFTVALLHDIGVLALCYYAPDEYAVLASRAISENTSLSELETEELGFDHTEIGAEMLERWGLPRQAVDAARWHHAPDRAPPNARMVASVVHALDHVVASTGVAPLLAGLCGAADLEALRGVGLAALDMTRIIDEVRPAVDRAGALAQALGARGSSVA